MSDQQKPVLKAAVAIVAAASFPTPPIPVEELLEDTNPLDVLAVIARALHLTLGVAVGTRGREAVLATLGLDAAQDNEP